MLNLLYQLITFITSLLLFPFFLISKRGRVGLRQRYGFWSLNLGHGDFIWIHGASAGELNGLVPVLNWLRRKYPGVRLLGTATSTTGLDRIRSYCDEVRLLPFDNEVWIRRALSGSLPRAFIFSETELWPGVLRHLSVRGVPIYLLNARISDYSYPYYKALRFFVGPLVSRIDLVLASNDLAKERFAGLGTPQERTVVTGNAKYDVRPSMEGDVAPKELRAQFFADDSPVVVLGSVRPGEEQIWLPAINDCCAHVGRVNVVVAPRHKERFDYFARRLEEYGFSVRRRSLNERFEATPEDGKPAALLLDTYGELERIYSFADLAFIGGTIVDFGGHNPLEAAAYGACIALGPYCKNIEDVFHDLVKSDAVASVNSEQEAIDLLALVARRSERIRGMGQRGRDVWRRYMGAGQRIIDVLEQRLSFLKEAA